MAAAPVKSKFVLLPFFRFLRPGCWCFLVGAMVVVGRAAELPRGLPFIRSYPLDEIGNVPRSLQLGFDRFGRVAVMYDGVYSVLNDASWVDCIDSTSGRSLRVSAIRQLGGRGYYGARGSWGLVEYSADGDLETHSLVSADAPAWTRVTPFLNFFHTEQGVYFYGIDGVVCWDFEQQRNFFYEMPRATQAFPVGARVFVSSEDGQLRELPGGGAPARIVAVAGLTGESVLLSVRLDAARVLLTLSNGALVEFDGETVRPWPAKDAMLPAGRITFMVALAEGGVAIAVADRGVYMFSGDGKRDWALDLPELRRVESMAAGEPGVLWVAGESDLRRIFYGSTLTGFGEPQGFTAVWPTVSAWGDRVMICSNRSLYEARASAAGYPSPCRLLSDRSVRMTDHVAARGAHLLVGNEQGVLAMDAGGNFSEVGRIANVSGLAFLDDETCVAIGGAEIAAFRFREGRWRECADRIAGVGDAPVRFVYGEGLWVERGGEQVGRLRLRDGKLEMRPVPLAWRDEPWTNVGVVGDRVILSGSTPGNRQILDAQTAEPIASPKLEQLLNRSPYWILRITEDEAGVLWATHRQGVVTFVPRDDGYQMDASTFLLRNDAYPAVFSLPGGETWIGAGRSLYRVQGDVSRPPPPPPAKLVSLQAGKLNREFVDPSGQLAEDLSFPFAEGNLSFRFCSGTYAWRTPPEYRYRLQSTEPWRPVDASLMLRFPNLSDGDYRLEVRELDADDSSEPLIVVPFTVEPPWYRTSASYAAYIVALAGGVLATVRWVNQRSLRRNTELEKLVRERTHALEDTMQKLGEETRHAATLAERSRLAGEIHDSIQQGLSGAILHLDTTMDQPTVPADVNAQLSVVRKMLSYSREEVQQAVWNLESPLLQNSSLGDALGKIAGFINSGSTPIEVVVLDEPNALDSATRHDLLRIAQEAITNAVKHAEALKIVVSLQSDDSQVTLSVQDDGKGFEVAKSQPIEGHFGLRGLRSRARRIMADVSITSSPGVGTTIRVVVPISAPSKHDRGTST
ncbi:ATP-binding protein [Synoicihabitans lomoniglobus]|uniref:Histidine kinase n=1 Tax=Synoicihabitans lomoniglobus TaxID=2909285 RepID=A0AAF0CQ41_9BACT|nr:sensor histidine kinase [Opitutaceae bacterium LMO-M01]WED65972.1 histidine kinase [Opitutaceae bacterium LMO-M01]